MSKLEKLKPSKSLATLSYTAKISIMMIDKIKQEFPKVDLNDLRNDKRLLKFTMDILEHIIKDQKEFSDKNAVKAIDKTELIVTVILSLFDNITPSEKEDIKSTISFIVEEFYIIDPSFFSRCVKSVRKVFHM